MTSETPTISTQVSSAEYVISEIKRHKKGALVVAVIALLVVAVAGVGLYRFVNSKNQTTTKLSGGLSPNLKIQRLTVNGKASDPSISPDGKWVAYVSRDGTQRSLWIRQVVTNSNIQIVPPANVGYRGATFSQDGSYVYYVVTEPGNPAGVLYQAPSIGGPPRKILANVDSPITLSPDAKRIAFIRNNVVASKEYQLIVANVDGTDARKLAARKIDAWFNEGGCGWSPDGKIIACPAGSYSGGIHQTVIIVDAETGEQNELARQRFRMGPMGAVSWLADGSGLVVSAAEEGPGPNQLWLISYPGGEGHKITNDLNGYFGSRLTADSKILVTVHNDGITNIWTASSGDTAAAKEITSGKSEGNGSLAWTPDGRIVYTSNASGNQDIWIMKSDGSGQKQLTTPPGGSNPTVSPDGRYIVFVSNRGGLPSLWRMDTDGGNLKQLTDQQDPKPQISPDSQWVVFNSWRTGKKALWKVSIDGGQPVQITDKFTSSPGISPDGKLIACFYQEEETSSPRIMILPFDGGPPVKVFDTPSTVDHRALDAAIAWTTDGRGIVYIDSLGGTPNLWSQSLDGGPPKKLTDFKENGVWRFAWSRDGKQLALTRGTVASDVVLIRDFK